jgi:hypothetical protein
VADRRCVVGVDGDELDGLVERLGAEHDALCLRRWAIFDRIDVLRAEHVRRVREAIDRLGPDEWVRATVARGPRRSGVERILAAACEPEDALDAPLQPLPPLRRLSDAEVVELLRAEERAEARISLRRAVVWHRLAQLLAEQDR